MAVSQRGPPSLRTRFPRLIEKLSQSWKGRAVVDVLPGEEGGAVKLSARNVTKSGSDQQEAGSSAGEVGGCVAAHTRSHQCYYTKDDI